MEPHPRRLLSASGRTAALRRLWRRAGHAIARVAARSGATGRNDLLVTFATVAALFAMWIAIAVAVDSDYRSDLQAAERAGVDVARALAQREEAAAKGSDFVLKVLRNEWTHERKGFHDTLVRLRGALSDYLVADVRVLDRAGTTVYADGRSEAAASIARKAFAFHARRSADDLLVGSGNSAVSHDAMLAFSRPLLDSRNQIAGIVSIVVAPSGGARNAVESYVGAGGEAWLLHADGATLWRSTAHGDPSPQVAAALKENGRGKTGTLVDDAEQPGGGLYSYARVAGYPLAIVTRKRLDEVLAAHRSERSALVASGIAASLLLVLIARLVIVWDGNRAEAEDKRRVADALLRRSEDRSRAFADVSSDWYWEIDDSLCYVYVSEGVRRFSGIDPDRYIGRKCTEMTESASTDEKRAFEAKLESRADFALEYSRFDAGRGTRWVSLRARPVVDAGGVFRGYRGASIDITERKQEDILERTRAAAFGLLTQGAPMPAVLGAIARGIESAIPPALCSILLADLEGKRLRLGAAPSLPESYNAVVDGLEIGPRSGSCGAAAFTGACVVAEDIRTHPWWEPFREPAAAAGLASCWSQAVRGESGKVLGTFAMYRRERYVPNERDVRLVERCGELAAVAIERARAMSALRESEERLSGVVQSAGEAIVLVDGEFRVVLFNAAAERIFGCPSADALGKRVDRFVPERFRESHLRRMAQVAAESRDGPTALGIVEIVASRCDGSEFPAEISVTRIRRDGRPLYAMVLRDLTDTRRDAERIGFLSSHDPLTALPNRSLLIERVADGIGRARRNSEMSGVLVLGLDRFKQVNDVFGHLAGDGLLREVAERLGRSLRDTDTLARLGGDVFAASIDGLKEVGAADVVARKLLAVLERPFDIEGQPHRIGASVGISVAPGDGVDAPTLLRKADLAMYRAKSRGGGMPMRYAAAMDMRTREQLLTETGLWRALERNEFVLHFQPRLSVADRRITGMEALLRWNRPAGGMLAPGAFVPLAESSGAIVPIGKWVLRAACESNAIWQRQGLPRMRVSVNLSPAQFRDSGLVDEVEHALGDSGLEPSCLELEITESMVITDAEQSGRTLKRLRAMGVAVTIDDFGTGYSSLTYLKRFPVDHLKIDRAFVADVPGERADETLVRTIVAMAHGMGLTTTAEGVETEAQLRFLHDSGCDEIQGYLFSRPVPADDFETLVRSHHARP